MDKPKQGGKGGKDKKDVKRKVIDIVREKH
jgi:hypothetical protein